MNTLSKKKTIKKAQSKKRIQKIKHSTLRSIKGGIVIEDDVIHF